MSWIIDALAAFCGGGAAIAVASWLGKRWVDHRLQLEVERHRSQLAAQMQHGLELLKRDLADTLAQRTRRADYVRAQIQHLYGPLAFLVESSARCLDTNREIMSGYHEYFGRFTAPGTEEASREMDEVIETANRYVHLVVENNKEAVKILRTGWGWLDAEDIDDASQYLTDIARHAVEFEEGKKLPFLFYTDHALKNAVGPPSFIRPAFIERVRGRLREKQEELAGLTGVAVPWAAQARPRGASGPALNEPDAKLLASLALAKPSGEGTP